MTDHMKEAERLMRHYTTAVLEQNYEAIALYHFTLLAHIQRGAVPEGWQLVPKEPTKDMVEAAYDNVTGGGGRAAIYAAMLAAAPAPDHFRDAAKMVPAPAEVPMPEDDMSDALGELAGVDTHDVNLRDNPESYEILGRLLHTYGDDREAAGYARGLAEAGRDAERYRWLTQHAYIGECFTHDGVVFEVHNTDRQVPIDGDVDAAIDAALRGEVK